MKKIGLLTLIFILYLVPGVATAGTILATMPW
jgi:hypothetical protein